MRTAFAFSLVVSFFALNCFARNAFDAVVEKRLDQVVSVFENSDPVVHYNYIENISDGRGYTAGKVGFTTATGDLLELVESYLAKKKNPALLRLLPVLVARAKESSGSVAGLEQLPTVWENCAKDPVFRKTQDEVADRLYRQPARKYLKLYKLKTALAYLIFYDSLVQHGEGNNPDSFSGIVKKMRTQSRRELNFLSEFLKQREAILLHPADPDTADEWRESVDRVHALRHLLDARMWDLKGPMTLHVWGQDYHLE